MFEQRHTTLKIKWSFGPDASYLVVGGFGGVGKAILEWMVDKGARHLIVPSRSGPSSQKDIEFLAELISRGVQVMAPCCDVSSATELATILQQCSSTMPPIRGCINGAMVLQVWSSVCLQLITIQSSRSARIPSSKT